MYICAFTSFCSSVICFFFYIGVRDHDFVIGLFQDAVNTLTMSPGHYIAIIDSLLETLQMFISEAGTMQSLVDIILKQV